MKTFQEFVTEASTSVKKSDINRIFKDLGSKNIRFADDGFTRGKATCFPP
jgi:hypothetical protein